VSNGRTVAIIGGGVIGLCCAWYALREGYRVIVVERGAPDHDACSLGNSGLIVPSHFTPLAAPGVTGVALRSLFDARSPLRLHPRLEPHYLRWCWLLWRSATAAHVARSGPALRDLSFLSLRCYGELADQWNDSFGLHRRGLLLLCATQRGFDEEAHLAETAQRLGIDAQVLDAAAAAQLEPSMRMSIAGAVRYPLDAYLTPQTFVAEITRRLQAAGVEFHWSTPITSWRTSGRRVLAARTGDTEIAADHFVVAAGAWSAVLARSLGLRMPLEAGKGYNLTLPRPRAQPIRGAILSEARIAVTPMGETLRFAGTLELAGLDTSIDRRRIRALIDAIARYYPDFTAGDFDGVQPWSGLRPCSPDGLPYIGRSSRCENLVLATGHAMMGMSLAPATGLVVSELLSGRLPSVPMGAFAAERFD
jgi:D-amino-acid dehydrogenase